MSNMTANDFSKVTTTRTPKQLKKERTRIEGLFLEATTNKQRKAAQKQIMALTAELLKAKKVKKAKKAKDKQTQTNYGTKLQQLAEIGFEDEKEAKPVYAPWTDEEKELLKKRIWNEKRNIQRQCKDNPRATIAFIEANTADEKNAAVRFARRDYLVWAKANINNPAFQNMLPC